MARLEFDTRNFCPALQRKSLVKGYHPNAFKMELFTDRGIIENETCQVGLEQVSVVVLGDRMVHKRGPVEIKCNGCKHLPEGFSKTVTRKIA